MLKNGKICSNMTKNGRKVVLKWSKSGQKKLQKNGPTWHKKWSSSGQKMIKNGPNCDLKLA